ncbi:MAG: C10 family peptidase [Muribaculaceae bacterium]|nr:C10 family peptidase [Muribaculaceae bacterium]
MNKILSLLVLGMGFWAFANGAPISPEQALQRGMGDLSMKVKGKTSLNMRHVHTFYGESKDVPAYVFENTSGGGFVIMAGDDIAYPILGYSEAGCFDVNNIPPQLKYWISTYLNEIEYASKRIVTTEEGKSNTRAVDTRKSIDPLVKSKWDQGEPFFNECPELSGRHCYTGCVATSMAQVMNYFKYPEKGVGTGTAIVNRRKVTMDFGERAFDWENMLDNYIGTFTDTQASAVAYLMKACGFAVNMTYGLDASGAVSALIASGMRDYFQYDGSITFEARVSYSTSEWENIIYDNIAKGSPVIYNGNDGQVGHSFICDGYSSDGFFHINWGWGGMADGYFLLNALNPEALGTGGGTGGGFNYMQAAVLNISKPSGNPVVEQVPYLTAYGLLGVDNVTVGTKSTQINVSLQSGYGNLHAWRNETMSSMSINVGGVLRKVGSSDIVLEQEGSLAGLEVVNISPGEYYIGTAKIKVAIPSTLPDGDYTMTLCTRDTKNPSTGWIPIRFPYSYPDYILLNKTGNKVIATTVENPHLSIDGFELLGNLYYGRKANIKFNVANASDYELTESISLVLSSQGKEKFKSELILVSVPPHSSQSQEWYVKLYNQTGQGTVTADTEFDMDLKNDFSNFVYGNYGKIIMHPNPGDPTVVLKSMTIPGATKEEVEICGDTFSVLCVENKDNFAADISFRISKGYFDSKVYVDIAELAPNATSPNEIVVVKDQVFSQVVELNSGEEITLHVPISFSEGSSDKIYYLKCKYYNNRGEKVIGSLRFKVSGDSKVCELTGEDNTVVEYYNIYGIKVDNPVCGDIVIEKKGSKVRKIIF